MQVGVGCFVLNERQEVLVVQEGNGPLRGQGVWKLVTGLVDAGEDIVQVSLLSCIAIQPSRQILDLADPCQSDMHIGSSSFRAVARLNREVTMVWSCVAARAGLKPGGAPAQAAEREVLEETGVRATSAAVLALRQAHGFAFGKSDFFFVVALTCAHPPPDALFPNDCCTCWRPGQVAAPMAGHRHEQIARLTAQLYMLLLQQAALCDEGLHDILLRERTPHQSAKPCMLLLRHAACARLLSASHTTAVLRQERPTPRHAAHCARRGAEQGAGGARARRPEPGQRELVMQEDELDAVAWMPLEEYAANPHHAARPLWRQMTQACVAYARGEYRGMAGIKLENGFNGRSDLLVMGELAPQQAAL